MVARTRQLELALTAVRIGKKAVRIRIGIDYFKPIMQHIKESDQPIFDVGMDVGTAHPLHMFVSQRSLYACKLRPKLPSVSKAKTEIELSVFPSRFKKTCRLICYEK